MTDKAVEIKAAITAACGALTVLWGWFGWLVIALCACMALDYLTGSAAAIRAGEWSSSAARDGIWHKLGTIVAVLAGCILDLVIELVVANMALPFDYDVLFGPMVVVWCILTETGSLIENASKLGANIPPWLGKALAVLKNQVDCPAENTPGKK